MSHKPERIDKNCLNCGAIVAGPYCQDCGQENMVTHQSFGHLLRHFLFDLFHFDGKFFDTVKPLLFRPGYVPRAYISGQRVKFLDPIRMYLFTSAIFFLVFSAIGRQGFRTTYDSERSLSRKERFEVAAALNAEGADSNARKHISVLLDTARVVYMKPDSSGQNGDSPFFFNGRMYRIYTDSAAIEKRTEVNVGNNWFGRFVRRRMERLNERFMDDRDEAQAAFTEDYLHRMPILLFVSLPFFALLLKLLYVRRRSFYYADHLIFTFYHYIFSFLLLLLAVGVTSVYHYLHWKPLKWTVVLLLLSTMVSLFAGMRRFYGQSFRKTLFKFVLLSLLGTIMIVTLFIIFLLISAIQF